MKENFWQDPDSKLSRVSASPENPMDLNRNQGMQMEDSGIQANTSKILALIDFLGLKKFRRKILY